MLIRHKSSSLSISIHLYLSLYKSNPTLPFLNFQSFPDLAPPHLLIISPNHLYSNHHWDGFLHHPSLLNHLIMIEESQMGFPSNHFWLVCAITILKHMSSSMGRNVPYIMENKKWLKPPSKFHLNIFHLYNIFHGYSFTIMCKSPKKSSFIRTSKFGFR